MNTILKLTRFATRTTAVRRIPTQFVYSQTRMFSNFKPLSSDEETATPQRGNGKEYIRYNPEAEEPEIDPEEFKRMQGSLQKFAQAMHLGKYPLAQVILDEHRIDIEKYFPPEHPANCSVINNQAMLFKMNGKFEQAKDMFAEVVHAYT